MTKRCKNSHFSFNLCLLILPTFRSNVIWGVCVQWHLEYFSLCHLVFCWYCVGLVPLCFLFWFIFSGNGVWRHPNDILVPSMGLMAHGVLGHRVFCWHLVASCQHPYHIIRECSYTCDSQWKCYSCCILGNFIGTPFCSIALDRIFELLDCTQRHHLKESKDTHGNSNSRNKPILNNRSTVSDIQYEVVEKQL